VEHGIRRCIVGRMREEGEFEPNGHGWMVCNIGSSFTLPRWVGTTKREKVEWFE